MKKYYVVRFYDRECSLLITGRGFARDELDAETNAAFWVICNYPNLYERVDHVEICDTEVPA